MIVLNKWFKIVLEVLSDHFLSEIHTEMSSFVFVIVESCSKFPREQRNC